MQTQTKYNAKDNELKLIPKAEQYIQYMLEVLLKLPRVEKFSIGTEYKSSMYKMINNILYLNKNPITERLYIINQVDSELNCQRIYLRIMYKNRWIDEKKFQISINKIAEIGKIVGGLIKYYAKNNKE